MAAINGPTPAITSPGRTIRGSQKWSLRSCLTGPLRLIIKYNNDNKIIVKKMVMKMLKIINNEYIIMVYNNNKHL